LAVVRFFNAEQVIFAVAVVVAVQVPEVMSR
jgi:hypothetical protein